MMFDPVRNNVSFPELEEEIAAFWDSHDTFAKSLEKRKNAAPFVFYDGPPFATGLPHYGHLLAGTIKDVIPRYQTMRGRYVDRVFGWDCHGLPIEALAQEALGVSGAPSIKELGVDAFNEKCRSMVLTYVDEWEQTVRRMGRWVDFENGYKTMDAAFMESIWWVFKQLWDQGRIYRAHRIMPYSWKLNTPLSNFEANRNYKDVQDPAITVRLAVRTPDRLGLAESARVYFVAWTTTPWTLPENLALCVGPDIEYSLVREAKTGDRYLLATALVSTYFREGEPFEIEKTLSGTDLKGIAYEPLFPYFEDHPNAFVVLADDFVSTEEGTGIVHMAPAYGEDDYRVCTAAGVDLVDPLDEDARFTDAVPDFAGLQCKDADKPIIRWLKEHGKLVHQSTAVHSYPFCERTDTPLIYRAIDAWYVRVEDLREQLLASNAEVTWMPEYVGEKRFANWLAEAKDWNISRNRFWGSCLPVWVNDDDPSDMICVGSIDELEALSGQPVSDLHKHFIDPITIERDGHTYRRTPEVLDCWFESGAMPYAQYHYPFENREMIDDHFPADFIAEGLDQTRGWFYTLTVLSTALFGTPAFRNVVVNGLVLAEDGKKMSKRLKNYPPPSVIIDEYGADALRLFLLSSPVVRAENLCFSEDGVKECMRSIIIPLWNAYSFLVTYARVDRWAPQAHGAPPASPTNVLDQWILSRLQQAVADIRERMDNFDLQRAAQRFIGLIEELTNWYIRRSRRRFWKSSNDTDKADAYATLHHVLVSFTNLAAPFIPFVTEAIYRNLRTPQMPDSVHLCDLPEVDDRYLDPELSNQMADVMTAVSLGRHLRTQVGQRVRQPLQTALLASGDPQVREHLASMKEVIADELNVKNVEVGDDEEELVHLEAKANFKVLGPRLGRAMPAAATAIADLAPETIARLRAGNTVSLDIGLEEPLDIGMNDILVERHEKKGMTVANEGAITIALDTRLTDALVREGWARELISRIQNLRKKADLDVQQRIEVLYDLPDEPNRALEEFSETIRRETLAQALTPADLDGEAPININGQPCRLAVRPVA